MCSRLIRRIAESRRNSGCRMIDDWEFSYFLWRFGQRRYLVKLRAERYAARVSGLGTCRKVLVYEACHCGRVDLGQETLWIGHPTLNYNCIGSRNCLKCLGIG